MTLTADDIKVLSKPFRRAEHEFTRGYVYITEGAITARLDEVDPNWQFEIQQLTVRDKQGVCAARLTVNGVTRENVGMQAVEYLKDKATNQPTDTEAGEAEKGAVTDALKRCARLFGIGRYLLDDPPKVERGNDADFNKWLSAKQKTWVDANAPKDESKVVATIGQDTRPTPPEQPSPAPTTSTEPAASPEPKHVTVTNMNDLNAVFSDEWANALNEAETIRATEAQKQETNGKTFYRLIDGDKGISATTFSTTVLQLLGVNIMDLAQKNRKYQIPPVTVPIVQNGQYWNIDDELVKRLLASDKREAS